MQAQQEDRGGPSPSAPSGERSAEAVLGEVLVNQSALRTTTGAGARVEVGAKIGGRQTACCAEPAGRIGPAARRHSVCTTLQSAHRQREGATQGPGLPCSSPSQPPPQDEDLALAKMLQEQERAFMVISGGPAAPR
jgi:hypothetical protein